LFDAKEAEPIRKVQNNKPFPMSIRRNAVENRPLARDEGQDTLAFSA
jgi:hypothetical protein